MESDYVSKNSNNLLCPIIFFHKSSYFDYVLQVVFFFKFLLSFTIFIMF